MRPRSRLIGHASDRARYVGISVIGGRRSELIAESVSLGEAPPEVDEPAGPMERSAYRGQDHAEV